MEFRDKDLSGQDVPLDGNIFTGCTFRNCRVIFRAEAPFSLVECRFEEDVDWLFGGLAPATIEFLTAMYHTRGKAGQQVVEQLFDQIRRSR
jgi:hypothetical protein